MTLPRNTVVPGLIAQYESFARLLNGLSGAEWETDSRCSGWRVADVAAHVVGQLTDVVNFRLEGLGSPQVTQRQVEERRGRSAADLAEELEPATKSAADLAAAFDDAAWEAPGPAGVDGTLGFGLESLWFDTFLHADDIGAAVGRPPVSGDGLLASLSHIAQVLTDQGYPGTTLALQGVPHFTVGAGGRIVEGDPFEFVLVASGRADPGSFGLDEAVNIYR